MADSARSLRHGDVLLDDRKSCLQTTFTGREEQRTEEEEDRGKQATLAKKETLGEAERSTENEIWFPVNERTVQEKAEEIIEKELIGIRDRALCRKEEERQERKAKTTGGKGGESAWRLRRETSTLTDVDKEESGRETEPQSRAGDEEDGTDSEDSFADSSEVLADAFLVAVEEAEACTRDKHRHGASLFRARELIRNKGAQIGRSHASSCLPPMATFVAAGGVLCGGRNFVLQIPSKHTKRRKAKEEEDRSPAGRAGDIAVGKTVQPRSLKTTRREQAMTMSRCPRGRSVSATEDGSSRKADDQNTGQQTGEGHALSVVTGESDRTGGQPVPDGGTAEAGTTKEAKKSKGAASASSIVVHAEVDCLTKV